MTKMLKRTLSIILALAMLLSCAAVSYANETDNIFTADSLEAAADLLGSSSDGDCDCETSPVIIVPGIMQSQVYVQDENGNDLMTSDGFPIVEGMDMSFMIDMNLLVGRLPSLILPLLKMLILSDRQAFFDAASNLVNESFADHFFNPDGTRVRNIAVDEYWYSLEVCKEKTDKSYGYAKGYKKDENGNTLPTYSCKTEYDFIMKQVNMTSFVEKVGLDHAYYYAYSSFGDTFEIAEKLNDYVQMVKEQTGHDKVNIVFISLGGTIGNVYLSEFCNPADIDRVVFAAAAIDGSMLLGDLMGANFSLDDTTALYNYFLPSLLQFAGDELGWLGGLLNIVARIIPEKLLGGFVNDLLVSVVENSLHNLLANCPSMWALVPSELYPELSEKYISDEAHAKLKEKTDAYYNIQVKSAEKLKAYVENGMDIFIICGYNLALPGVVDSYRYSSDTIIHSESESAGATFALLDSTLGEDYVPAIDESYISPDNTVDAGTAALPDRTWFVRNQSHMELQGAVHDVIELCIQIALDKDIKDARVNNGGYPQFCDYRNLKTVEKMISRYGKLTPEQIAEISEADKAELDAAYNELVLEYESRAWSETKILEAEKKLYKIMYKLDLLGKDDQHPVVKYSVFPVLEDIFDGASNAVSKYYGDRDFWLFF